MANDIVILNLPLLASSIPSAGSLPGSVIGTMQLSFTNDDVSRMIGDGWKPLSHQMLVGPNGDWIVSIMCVRGDRPDPIELAEHE